MSQKTILLVEDNVKMIRLNRNALAMRGYRVLEATTIREARELAQSESLDLMVLDIMLPDGSGLDLCYELHLKSIAPILILSALDKKEDVGRGYAAGAVDYLTKPYDLDVLLWKVDAMLRFSTAQEQAESEFRSEQLRVDFTSRRAYLSDKDLLLEVKEFSVLEALIRHRGRFLSAQELYAMVWGMEPCDDVRTVRVRISSLRRKLQGRGSGIDIESNRGKGYRLVEQSRA